MSPGNHTSHTENVCIHFSIFSCSLIFYYKFCVEFIETEVKLVSICLQSGTFIKCRVNLYYFRLSTSQCSAICNILTIRAILLSSSNLIAPVLSPKSEHQKRVHTGAMRSHAVNKVHPSGLTISGKPSGEQ